MNELIKQAIKETKEELELGAEIALITLKSIIKKVSQDKEIYENLAAGYKNMYNALINEGFNQSQALELIKAQNTLGMMNLGNLGNS